jgi:glucose/arabinose dehydrogenase
MFLFRRMLLMLVFLASASGAHAVQLVNAYPHLTFSKPLFLTHPGDGTDRIFVVQQTGLIKVFPNDSTVTTTTTFLNVSAKISSSGGEEGLLGLTFHPNYRQNGYFYVDYTAPNPLRTVVSRFKVSSGDPNAADPTSEYKIIQIPQPYANHNGGMLAFGPDGYLYIGMGDGGSEGDPLGNGQNLTVLLGKILRIDVDDTTATTRYTIPPDNPFADNASGYMKEIWCWGMRNPWRFSFDTVTGLLWCGDVGQDSVEEIDLIHGGRNYGWSIMEGTHCYNPPSGCDTTGLTLPIKQYLHPLGEAITGGYVYWGYRQPGLNGAYIYADYVIGRMWMLRYQNGAVTADSQLIYTPYQISSFGTDMYSELYIVSYSETGTGTGIYRFAGPRRTYTAVDRGEGGASRAPVVKLWQNYPNPFNPATNVGYYVSDEARVTLAVYDVSGALVARIMSGRQEAGYHTAAWNGLDEQGKKLPSGVYFCRLEAATPGGAQTAVRKMVLLR